MKVSQATTAYYPSDVTCRKQLYVVYLMLREKKLAAQTEGDIKHLTDDPFDMGDLKRDAAIACIMQGGPEALGNALASLAFCEAADAGLTDPQWRFNNKVHWQAAACQAGHWSLAHGLGGELFRGLWRHGSLVHVPVILAHCVPGGWRCVPRF